MLYIFLQEIGTLYYLNSVLVNLEIFNYFDRHLFISRLDNMDLCYWDDTAFLNIMHISIIYSVMVNLCVSQLTTSNVIDVSCAKKILKIERL